MGRLWPILVLAVGLALGAILFLGEDTSSPLDDSDAERGPRDETRPELIGNPRSTSPRDVSVPDPKPATESDPAQTDEGEVFLEGVVLDDETGEPLAGAWVWTEGAREPCPRLPDYGVTRLAVSSGGNSLGDVAVWVPHPDSPFRQGRTTDTDGRFRFAAPSEVTPSPGSIDVFAVRTGYIASVQCRPSIPGDLALRLTKGLTLECTVTDTRGRPVAGAEIRARPGPETPATPGHASLLHQRPTDKDGDSAIDGLLPGDVVLEVEHPDFMPFTSVPLDPALQEEGVQITLTPALRTTLKIRTDDDSAPEHPTLLWETTGTPPRSGVVLLPRLPDTEDIETHWGPVRLPCNAPTVVLTVTADGYGTWVSEPVDLPPTGGDETIEVELPADTSHGTLRLSLEDDRGDAVHFANAKVAVAIARIDDAPPASAYVIQQDEDLHVTSLPAGTYRLMLSSAKFAPTHVDVTVDADREAEALVTVRPPAKVRVRFFAPERVLVRFRLTQGGRIVVPFPENAQTRGTDEATGEPILSAGENGMVLSGLATGTYVVQVISEDLTAADTVIRLTEGDTEEVEIDVQRR